MEKLIPLNVVIADRSYRIKLDPADEQVVRKTLKIINDKILEFKTQFSGKDAQDYVSMVILWYATQQQSGNELGFSGDLKESLNTLELLLDESIK